jgi:F-type H+-transporting ATPase subunit O
MLRSSAILLARRSRAAAELASQVGVNCDGGLPRRVGIGGPSGFLPTPHLTNPRSSALPTPPQGTRGLAEAAGKQVTLPPQYGIPGRYAAALYLAAAKGNQLDKVEKELAQISSLLAESSEFAAFVADPSLPTGTRVEGLGAVLKKMGASDITKRFIDVVLENNRSNELSKILEKFGDITAEQKGQVKAVVTTAEGLGRAEAEQITAGLKKMLSAGQSLVLEERVDPSIISRIVVDIGDKHVDMSVLSRVRKLQQIVRDAV